MKPSFPSIPMSQFSLLPILLLLSTLLAPPQVVAEATSTASTDIDATEKLSAYQVLESYNFPIGLLPKGVLSYDLDPKTGKFSAYLNGSCSFTISGYDLKYKSTISGVISKNKLSKLKGISVKILLFWINIVEVTRSDDELEFSVGILSADFPLEGFDVCPQCGCGFNCNSSEKVGRIGRSPFVSSS